MIGFLRVFLPHRRGRPVLALCAVLFAWSTASAEPIAYRSDEVRAAVETATDARTQTELPFNTPKNPPARRVPDLEVPSTDFSFTYIVWGLVAAGAIFLAYLIGREAIRPRSNSQSDGSDGEPEMPDYRPDAGTAEALLAEADRLAADGDYAEAVHLLLFSSIETIRAKLRGPLARSLTSREIVEGIPLPDIARDALRTIVAMVERSFFGGRDLDREDFATCRASYERFAFDGAPA